MAQRKSKKRPQPKHKRQGKSSQHDKRSRLDRRNPNRRATTHAKFALAGRLADFVGTLQNVLDRRIGFRVSIIVVGMLLACGRRTASSWFGAAGVLDDWDLFYACLASVGYQAPRLATALLGLVLRRFNPGPGGRILLALDDSPTARYGRCIEGTGVHHHPTPGPADGEWLYGHVWVTLAFLAHRPVWGVVALPLLSRLYVRKENVPKLADRRGWTFRTKHELGVGLLQWFVEKAQAWGLGAAVWLVVDGAYAARPFLRPVLSLGVVVVSRLRKDARLWDLPPERQPGRRGRPRIYGQNRISLAKRAGQRRGWESIAYNGRGEDVTVRYKTFEATTQLVGGVIRVVLLETGVAYFCTLRTASVKEILEAVASRWAIEEQFHDVKEVWGAGEQQVRNVWSNVGCWHLNQWMFTLVELSTWDEPSSTVCDRTGRPWDNPDRRPSHADRRRAIVREMLGKELSVVLNEAPDLEKFRHLADKLFDLCA